MSANHQDDDHIRKISQNLNKLEAALEEEEEGTPEVEDISLDTLLTIIWIVLNITLGAF